MLRRVWDRLDRPARTALAAGVVLAVASVPLPTWAAILLGLASALVLGFVHPADATKVGVLVAAPILVIAFLFGFVRGFGTLVLLVLLLPSLILPVYLARIGATARTGPRP